MMGAARRPGWYARPSSGSSRHLDGRIVRVQQVVRHHASVPGRQGGVLGVVRCAGGVRWGKRGGAVVPCFLRIGRLPHAGKTRGCAGYTIRESSVLPVDRDFAGFAVGSRQVHQLVIQLVIISTCTHDGGSAPNQWIKLALGVLRSGVSDDMA